MCSGLDYGDPPSYFFATTDKDLGPQHEHVDPMSPGLNFKIPLWCPFGTFRYRRIEDIRRLP